VHLTLINVLLALETLEARQAGALVDLAWVSAGATVLAKQSTQPLGGCFDEADDIQCLEVVLVFT
jgi:hypothetical protein